MSVLKQQLPHGFIFAIFMTASMVGTALGGGERGYCAAADWSATCRCVGGWQCADDVFLCLFCMDTAIASSLAVMCVESWLVSSVQPRRLHQLLQMLAHRVCSVHRLHLIISTHI
jgi:hypothetical protein